MRNPELIMEYAMEAEYDALRDAEVEQERDALEDYPDLPYEVRMRAYWLIEEHDHTADEAVEAARKEMLEQEESSRG